MEGLRIKAIISVANTNCVEIFPRQGLVYVLESPRDYWDKMD